MRRAIILLAVLLTAPCLISRCGDTSAPGGSHDNDTIPVYWDTTRACSAPAHVGAFVSAIASNLSPTLTVTTNADGGAGSLRSVLSSADAGACIGFDASLVGKTISLDSALIVRRNVSIDASEAPGVTLSGNNRVRIFSVWADVNLTLFGLRVVDGRSTGGGSEPGGALGTGNNCTLTVRQCLFRNCVADCGGAVRAGYGTRTTIEDCTFLNNDGSGADNGFSAGGISTNGHGELIVRRCMFVGNRGYSGAAIYNLLQPVLLEECVFVGNISDKDGAALFTDEGNWTGPGASVGGHIIVRKCWIEGNESRELGGGLFLWANPLDTVLVEDCVLRKNIVKLGGQWNDAKGGAIRSNGIFTVRNTAFIENTAEMQGGALWIDGNGPHQIINCTFWRNRVTDDAGGAMNLNVSGPVHITNCTIAENFSQRACGAFWFGNPDLPITITNSIIANNTAGSDHSQDQVGYAPIDGGGNIEYPAPSNGARRIAAGSTIADPLLGPLSKAGSNLVLPLQSTSPAIGLAVAAQAPAVDARGITRDASPDAGAFEYRANDAGVEECPADSVL